MLAKVWSAAVRGIDGYPVSVELDLANGLPNYTTVGLPDSAVRESRERVVAALRNSGYDVPCRRITVNLAPAQFRKRGTQLDLPIAMGVLAASGQIPAGDWLGRYCFLGELALDGGVNAVPGILPMAASAKGQGREGVLLPSDNAGEAASVGIASYGIASLREAAGFVSGAASLDAAAVPPPGCPEAVQDIVDVRGQHLAKRALEVAAAGGHSLLLSGPPGTGKSMLAQRLPGLLPPLEREEALEVAKIQSVAGILASGSWPSGRPFRAPHHSVTTAGLIGGGSPCRPGEATLAHRGVLFLDELAEFKRESLEALRVPLESGVVTVSRLRDRVEYPAAFSLVAAMNPCPCGYSGHPGRSCVCSPAQAAAYRSRISGPLLDRIDLRVEVAPLTYREWRGEPKRAEGSDPARQRVSDARRRQALRFEEDGSIGTNAGMRAGQLRGSCRLTGDAEVLLEAAAAKWALSARGMDRAVRVARTVADLDDSRDILRPHMAEAIILSGRDGGGA